MAWNTNSAVISVIMLEGARNSSAFFSNSTLPLEASIRIAVGASPSKPPSSFLAPCTLLLAAYTRPPHPTQAATTAAIRLRQERPVADLGLREGDRSSVIGHALSWRSNSWKYRKQHRFYLVSRRAIRLRRCSNAPIVSLADPLNKISQTSRKSDALFTHHFRQRDRNLSARTGHGPAGGVLPRLAGTVLFLAASNPGDCGGRLPCWGPPYP